MVVVDGSSLQANLQPKLVDFIWESVATCHWACIHKTNWVNSCDGCGHYDGITNIGIGIIRPHCSTTYVDVACCYRLSSMVCLSVTLVSLAKMAEPIEMPFGLSMRVGPENHISDGGPDPPWEGQFWGGGNGRPILKYRDTLRSSVQKRLNRLRCHLGYGLRWSQGGMYYMGPRSLMQKGNY